MVDVAVCIGSNSGDRLRYIYRMEEMLRDILILPVVSSMLMETEPIGVTDIQPWYYNRIISGRYNRSAFDLLEECHRIERILGRVNKGMHAQRTADIDILLFGNEKISTEILTIPHAAMISRRFCLEGLFQIMPDIIVGTMQKTVREYYNTMPYSIGKQRVRFIVQDEGGV